MAERVFPILGTSVPPMLGRQEIMSRMVSSLTKPTPDHLQMVGPRFAGKTVVLHELASRMREAGSPYTAVVLWDLGHQTPETDELFMQCLARQMGGALVKNHGDLVDALQEPRGNPYQDIAAVLDLLNDEGGRVLAIMDGFDKPLSNGQLTRNLWDQLRELGLKPSLRLITASRRTLTELIRHPEAQTSDFWNIFDPKPVRIGCFDDGDLATAIAKMTALELSAGAQTELWNASNGFPIMLLEILNSLDATHRVGPISPEAMRAACEDAFPALSDKLNALWTDCSPSCHDLFHRVLEHGALARTGVAASDADHLIERGFVHHAANRLQRPNRLLARFLAEHPNEGSAIVRLFGAADAYDKNFRSVLERRIGHLVGLDPTLKRYLERGTEDLPGHPDVFMTNVRGVVNQAFELIWQAEMGGRSIPSGWMSTWKYNQERGVDDWQTTFPQGVHRVRLLNLMTGTDRSPRCAKHVSKATYVLMNAVHAFGDFGQHQEGAHVDTGVGYAALHLCIELAAALARELPEH